MVWELNKGDRIVRENQDKYIRTHKLKFNGNVGFIKFYNGAASELCKVLTPSELSVLFKLIDYIGYDCILRVHNKVLCMQDMASILNLNYSTIRKIIPKLIKRDIIKHCTISQADGSETKYYIVNPFLFFRGSDIDKCILDEFKNSEWQKRLCTAEHYYQIR